MADRPTVLVTGATGYVGGRLVPRLLAEGFAVRAMVRGGAARVAGREWADDVEVVDADVTDPRTLPDALRGVRTAYYLIHSMKSGHEFRERDRVAGAAFGEACRGAGVERIVYLGGLGDPADDLSHHLKSRQETGRALAEAGVPVLEFRAAVIVGSGSLSFEIVRHLAERLPVMLFPKWASTRIQPIAVRDVLEYLTAAAAPPPDIDAHQIVEIGGPTVTTFGGMIREYARVRGLRRVALNVPVITPRLSAYWINWTTPVTFDVARPLIEGARNEVVVRDDSAARLFPDITPVDYETAIRRAVDRLDRREVETIWSDALTTHDDKPPVLFTSEQGMFIERRRAYTRASPDAVFRAFCGIGGDRGWALHWLWMIRGWMDQLIGGPGLRRGRRHPDELRAGDALDWWRVEEVVPGRRLLLRAEMKLPGRGWLRYEATPESVATKVTQTALFEPRGLLGNLYWWSIVPLHAFVFRAMLNRVIREAETASVRTAEPVAA